MFKLSHHNKILTILHSLDSHIFKESNAYFGGGTLMTLEFDEYRWSKDIDFICPIASSGYRNLRSLIFDKGEKALLNNQNQVEILRCTTDQYAIRMLIKVDDELIKTEIIAESRFELDPPRYPSWSPVACLSVNDCVTAKLLANSDRYMDDSVEARDLIDLAVLRLQTAFTSQALNKAEKAYEVIRPLKRAIARFQERETYRAKCFSGLRIDHSQIPQIMDGIDLLAVDLSLPNTKRTFKEVHHEV